MRDPGEFKALSGGGKKFLYGGPASSKGQSIEDDPFSFSPRHNNKATPRGGIPPIDLDNVWSIKNVGLKPQSGNKSVRSEPSTLKSHSSSGLNTSSTYYSRHGGMRGKASDGPRDGIQSSKAATGSSSMWSSSGHNIGRPKQPPTFGQPSERTLQESKNRFQVHSPLNRDVNDF